MFIEIFRTMDSRARREFLIKFLEFLKKYVESNDVENFEIKLEVDGESKTLVKGSRDVAIISKDFLKFLEGRDNVPDLKIVTNEKEIEKLHNFVKLPIVGFSTLLFLMLLHTHIYQLCIENGHDEKYCKKESVKLLKQLLNK